MATYVCSEIETVRNIYGGYDCAVWVENQTFLDLLAITKEDAVALTIAICSLYLTAFIGGLIGRVMLDKTGSF